MYGCPGFPVNYDAVVAANLAASNPQLVYASACLRELPGCLFVATNLDHADYIGNNRMMPGTGALVAALQVASGMEPVSRPAPNAAAAAAVLVITAVRQRWRSTRTRGAFTVVAQPPSCCSQH
jgi:ribonucleotide monophosphatase NagD (HAD superfamily)